MNQKKPKKITDTSIISTAEIENEGIEFEGPFPQDVWIKNSRTGETKLYQFDICKKCGEPFVTMPDETRGVYEINPQHSRNCFKLNH